MHSQQETYIKNTLNYFGFTLDGLHHISGLFIYNWRSRGEYNNGDTFPLPRNY